MSDRNRWVEELDEQLLDAYGVVSSDVPGSQPEDYPHDLDGLHVAFDDVGQLLDEMQIAIALLLGISIGGA